MRTPPCRETPSPSLRRPLHLSTGLPCTVYRLEALALRRSRDFSYLISPKSRIAIPQAMYAHQPAPHRLGTHWSESDSEAAA